MRLASSGRSCSVDRYWMCHPCGGIRAATVSRCAGCMLRALNAEAKTTYTSGMQCFGFRLRDRRPLDRHAAGVSRPERRDRVKHARIVVIIMQGLDDRCSAKANRIVHGDIAIEEVRFHFPSVDQKQRDLRRIAINMDMAIAGAWRRCKFRRSCHSRSIAQVL